MVHGGLSLDLGIMSRNLHTYTSRRAVVVTGCLIKSSNRPVDRPKQARGHRSAPCPAWEGMQAHIFFCFELKQAHIIACCMIAHLLPVPFFFFLLKDTPSISLVTEYWQQGFHQKKTDNKMFCSLAAPLLIPKNNQTRVLRRFSCSCLEHS